jgi:NAD(P)-dependent dehydrogenase (short-subunit alcohol dehydrogenase family)
VTARLTGRIAVVTGAATGIGRAIALALSDEGAEVLVSDRDAEGARRTAAAIGMRGGQGRAQPADVTREDDVRRLADAAADLGGPHVLVCNAGVQQQHRVDELAPAEWDATLAVNLRGVYLCCRAALPAMRAGGGGSIVTVGSIVASWQLPGLGAYGASKAGLLALSRAVALENGPAGVRCNCICPGYIDSGMGARYFDAQPDPQASREQAAAGTALRRIGRAEEVAALAVFLASEESSYCTGQSFVVDGGLTAGAPG